ncbi:hypothetical protein [Polaribacter ponticola]|uniref:Uncharacterized protein n=1 Tax=Polaribacter ponticola TaxID=2978475 RepID=A0ABT5S9C6_9FLAO|nr:hypothetical protein [Polaribacter sp. MSW5]MDD7914688.1 hypothetical protein [Polaribacter sp. MSW5]
MKKIILIILISISTNLFADAGYAYRFFINVDVAGENLIGYVYHYSYEKFQQNEDFYSYLKRTSSKNEINIYKNIKTLSFGINYDFTVKDSEVKINFLKNKSIRISEYLSFTPSYRLIKLNEKEFRIINQKGINYIFINKEGEEDIFSENCSDILITTDEITQLNQEKEKIKPLLVKKVKELRTIKGQKEEPYFKYYSKLQKEFLDKNYLLISVCSAL